jgi:poly(3-hydroxybutyrate) depolymerase
MMCGVLLLFTTSLFAAKAYDKTAEIQGITVHYKVVLPKDFDPAKTYPAVLAFPPGSQTMDMVLTTVMQNWVPEADRYGYIVVVPAAPNGRPFTGAGAKIFPEFIEQLLHEYKVRDNKFHIAGMSNGGRSAFHIAALHPQYFLSITGLPGYLPDPTPERVAAISRMCIYMYVGQFDTDWVQEVQNQAAMFQGKGYSVRSSVERGEGHVMRTVAGPGSARMYKNFEEVSHGCGPKH